MIREQFATGANTYRIKVTTGIKKESVTVLSDGRLAVAVDAARKGGEANARACALVAAHFSVPIKNVRIVKGHTASTKTIAIA